MPTHATEILETTVGLQATDKVEKSESTHIRQVKEICLVYKAEQMLKSKKKSKYHSISTKKQQNLLSIGNTVQVV